MECVGTERKEGEMNGQMAWGRPDRWNQMLIMGLNANLRSMDPGLPGAK